MRGLVMEAAAQVGLQLVIAQFSLHTWARAVVYF